MFLIANNVGKGRDFEDFRKCDIYIVDGPSGKDNRMSGRTDQRDIILECSSRKLYLDKINITTNTI